MYLREADHKQGYSDFKLLPCCLEWKKLKMEEMSLPSPSARSWHAAYDTESLESLAVFIFPEHYNLNSK